MSKNVTRDGKGDTSDYGSEQLPTNISVNPWDMPVQEGALPPSAIIAGESEEVADGGDISKE